MIVQLLLLSGAKNSLLSAYVQLRARQGCEEDSWWGREQGKTEGGQDTCAPNIGTEQGDRSRKSTASSPESRLWSSLSPRNSLREKRGFLMPVLLGAKQGMEMLQRLTRVRY